MDFRPEEKTLPIVKDDNGKKYYKIRYKVLIYLKEATVTYKWYFNGKNGTPDAVCHTYEMPVQIKSSR